MAWTNFHYFSGRCRPTSPSAINPALTTVASGQQATIFAGIPLSDTMARQPKAAPVTITMKVFVPICVFFLDFCRTSKSTQPYQRGRASITGLRLNVDKGMKTGRLIGVAVSRLVRLLGFALGASRQSPGNRIAICRLAIQFRAIENNFQRTRTKSEDAANTRLTSIIVILPLPSPG